MNAHELEQVAERHATIVFRRSGFLMQHAMLRAERYERLATRARRREQRLFRRHIAAARLVPDTFTPRKRRRTGAERVGRVLV